MLLENDLRKVVRKIIIENEIKTHPELGKYLTKGLERAYDIERGVSSKGSAGKIGSDTEYPKIEYLLLKKSNLSKVKPSNIKFNNIDKETITDLTIENQKIYKDFFKNLHTFLSNKEDYDFKMLDKIEKEELKKIGIYNDFVEKVKAFNFSHSSNIPSWAKKIIELFK